MGRQVEPSSIPLLSGQDTEPFLRRVAVALCHVEGTPSGRSATKTQERTPTRAKITFIQMVSCLLGLLRPPLRQLRQGTKAAVRATKPSPRPKASLTPDAVAAQGTTWRVFTTPQGEGLIPIPFVVGMRRVTAQVEPSSSPVTDQTPTVLNVNGCQATLALLTFVRLKLGTRLPIMVHGVVKLSVLAGTALPLLVGQQETTASLVASSPEPVIAASADAVATIKEALRVPSRATLTVQTKVREARDVRLPREASSASLALID